MTTWQPRRGDVGVVFAETLVDAAGAAVDLTDATEILWIASHLERALVIEAAAVNVQVDEAGATGAVRYTSVATDLDIAGPYRQEWQVTFAGGDILTFPVEDYNYVLVLMDLGPADEADVQGTALAGETCAPWATIDNFDDYDANPTDITECFQMASDVLFNLTGRRWPGSCTDTIRPQAVWRASERPPRWWPGASAYGFCSCNRPREHGCSGPPELRLPNGPVTAITSVRIDGALVDSSTYRVDDDRFLVRLGGDVWPCCQDMTADPASDDDTFEVVYTYGSLPPVGGRRAAVVLGREYLLSRATDDGVRAKCRLPRRVTTITRQGTTIAVIDPLDLVAKGMTGIAEVDQWVASIMIGDARRRSTVLVPGQTRSARRTG